MWSIQGRFIARNSIGGGVLFILTKATQWCFEAKKLDFPDVKINTWIKD